MATKDKTPTRTPDISCEVDPIYRTVNITYSDGDNLQLNANSLTADLLNMAIVHGLKQKLVDAGAMSRNPDTGRSATLADKKAAIREVYERLLSGEWNKRREGDGTGNTGLLVAALLSLYPAKTKADVEAWLEGMTKEQIAALRLNARVAAEMTAIKAKRAGADAIDSDELLNGLGD